MTFNLEDSDRPIEGEIYISMDRIFSNAKIFNNSMEEEIQRVVIARDLLK